MKVVNPSVELWGPTPSGYIPTIEWIEQAGRVCYKSEDKITKGSAEKFIGKICKSGHVSVIEHSNFVVKKPVDSIDAALDIVGRVYISSRFLDAFIDIDAGELYIGGNLRAWAEASIDNEDLDDMHTPFINAFGHLFPQIAGAEVSENSEWVEVYDDRIPKELQRVTFKFICDRGVSHELVRHRPCSFCLSGDTEVVAFTKKGLSPKRWTLSQLYSWQNDPKRSGRLKLIRLRSVNKEGVIVPGKIKQIIDSGPQQVFKVTTESGRVIKATSKHRMLTPNGYVPLGYLTSGDYLTANGLPAEVNKPWLEQKYLAENNTLQEMSALMGCCVSTVTKTLRRHGINKPLSLRKNRKPGRGKKGMFDVDARQKISERMSGSGNHRWLGDEVAPGGSRIRAIKTYEVGGPCEACKNKPSTQRHHKDKNPLNNKKSNIMLLCPACHRAFHAGAAVITVFSDKIVSIEPAGVEHTYDIEMLDNPHNFVAEGLVVHNSQESTRYVNYKEGCTFVRPYFYGDTEKYVAWEAAMRRAETSYKIMCETGAVAQAARSVLPNSIKTEVVVTANIAELDWIDHLRNHKTAHPDFQFLAAELKRLREEAGL